MSIRPTQGRIFAMISAGISSNTAKLIRAQEQASSGKRIVRASDDPVGTSVSLSLRRQIGAIESFVASTSASRPELEQASARLQEGSGVIADIRALFIQGMNGTLNFAIGQSLQQIVIPIVDDNLVEAVESLRLSLTNASGGAPIAGQTTTLVSINDDDTAIDFEFAGHRVFEDRTNALITVRRTGLTNGVASADFATADGTSSTARATQAAGSAPRAETRGSGQSPSRCA